MFFEENTNYKKIYIYMYIYVQGYKSIIERLQKK